MIKITIVLQIINLIIMVALCMKMRRKQKAKYPNKKKTEFVLRSQYNLLLETVEEVVQKAQEIEKKYDVECKLIDLTMLNPVYYGDTKKEHLM